MKTQSYLSKFGRVITLSLTLGNLVVSGGVIIENNFNTNTSGFIVDAAAGTIADLSGTESPFSKIDLGTSLRLEDNTDQANPVLISDGFDPDDAAQPLKVSFDYYNLGLEGSMNHSFELRSPTVQGVLLDIMTAQTGSVGFIRYRTSTEFVNVAQLQEETWYHFDLVFSAQDASFKTFSMTVYEEGNSTPIVQEEGLPFRTQINVYETAKWFFNVGPAGLGDGYLLDNIYIYTGDFPSELIFDPVEETWNGYAVDANGWVSTGDWLGWVNVSLDDSWVWSTSLDKYIYVPDGSGWVYVPQG